MNPLPLMRRVRGAFGRVAFGGVLAAAVAVLALRARQGVETDLYSLADARHGGVLRTLAAGQAAQGRVLLEGTDPAALAACAAEVRANLHLPVRDDWTATRAHLAAHAAGLLAPATRALLLAGRYDDVAADALARLFGPVPPLFSVKDDPFLLATDYALSMSGALAAGWTLQDGDPCCTRDGRAYRLLTLDLGGVPARAVGDFLRWAEARNARAPDVRLWCGGPPFHAARATAHAVREINALSLMSLALVVLLGWRLFGSLRFVPALLSALGCGLLVATAALFAAVPRPHVLTFVFGTSLIGLAVDYVYHARAAGGARRVRRPLTLALLTTAAGLAPLLLAAVPVLRQMALFTLVGLATVYAFVLLGGGGAEPVAAPRAGAPGRPRRTLPPVALLLLALALAAAVLLRFPLAVTSSPASLYTPDAFLAAGEQRLAAVNPLGASRFVLVRGSTVQEALAREEAAGVRGLSALIPSFGRQRENARLVADLYAAAGAAYTAQTGLAMPPPRAGTDADLLDPEALPEGPLRALARAMIVPGGLVSPCPDGFASDDSDIVVLDPRAALEAMFAAFTAATRRLLGASLLALAILLAALFRRRFLRYAAPIAGAGALTAAALGVLGVPVTFFTLLCFFVLIGLGLDYVIFQQEEATAPATRRVVLYSFLTSFAGLGLLAATSFAVTRAMGITFACGLFFAWLCARLGGGGSDAPAPAPGAWHRQREQSAGRLRLLVLWCVYAWFGKTCLKILCVPVMLFIYPFARPARAALREFYAVLAAYTGTRRRPSHATLFAHCLAFAWSLADKTDACTLRKNLPALTVRDDAGARAFHALVSAGQGAFLISSHLGTIEVLAALGARDGARPSPLLHAFQQMGHDAVFTRLFARHLDTARVALHPVEEIGVETAVRMQEAIGRGELVLMAGDRVSAGSGRTLRHDFLGRSCAWPKGVFAFARLMEAPVFFVTCVRTGWNAYEAHFAQAAPAAARRPDALLDAYARFLEAETVAHPGQWHQFYRFFAAADGGADVV